MSLLIGLLFTGLFPPERPAPPALPSNAAVEADAVFAECALTGVMDAEAFRRAYLSRAAHHATSTILAVADMTRPSTEKRLFIIDLASKRLLLRTWVAHGRNSGDRYCTAVSNRPGSLQTSKGLYRVGERIVSPKHGDALMLHGLDKGVNCRAEEREIILHSADYVSAAFIAEHGRLGRSFGCPAVPCEDLPYILRLFADGGLLYVHAR